MLCRILYGLQAVWTRIQCVLQEKKMSWSTYWSACTQIAGGTKDDRYLMVINAYSFTIFCPLFSIDRWWTERINNWAQTCSLCPIISPFSSPSVNTKQETHTPKQGSNTSWNISSIGLGRVVGPGLSVRVGFEPVASLAARSASPSSVWIHFSYALLNRTTGKFLVWFPHRKSKQAFAYGTG